MKENADFFIVEKKVLPEIFIKVIKAKSLMDNQKAKTIKDAVNMVGISRSAFYKYKDSVFELNNNSRGRTLTIAINLENNPGLLSNVLNVIAGEKANILTINQTIPINNIANVTITVETDRTNNEIVELVQKLEKLNGVQTLKIIAREWYWWLK